MAGQDEAIIPAGTPFRTVRGGRQGRLEEVLGAGGQGAVYAVDIEGVRFAMKWYHPAYASIDVVLRDRLSRAIERGPPNDSFLWPIDLVQIAGSPSFGYVMRLRDPDYAGMRALISRPPNRIDPPLAVRATLCLHIAHSFLELHSSGFCYQDINFGNIFFHPQTGDILICDNDNVDIDGSEASVFGTRKFMAPEVVRRQAMPSTKTDLFSMAVLFFYVLLGWHPLDGRREAAIDVLDAAAETALYGTSPLFLFDPTDLSNGPVSGMHEPIVARWIALPPPLQALFVRSFTTGLRQPWERVLETEWRAAFAALAAATYACPDCGFEHTAALNATLHCASCATAMPTPPLLTIGRGVLSLSPGRQIPVYYLRSDRPMDFRTIAATVEAHPMRPEVWGLRNHMAETWRVQLPDSSAVAVPTGRTVRILHGTTIDFGGIQGNFVLDGQALVRA